MQFHVPEAMWARWALSKTTLAKVYRRCGRVQTGEVGTNVVLFPESSVISMGHYFHPDEMEKVFGPETEIAPDQFREGEELAFVAGFLRYHRVMAIETKAEEHRQIDEWFMSDLVRKRLGPLFK